MLPRTSRPQQLRCIPLGSRKQSTFTPSSFNVHIAQSTKYRSESTTDVHQKYQTAVSIGNIRRLVPETKWDDVYQRTTSHDQGTNATQVSEKDTMAFQLKELRQTFIMNSLRSQSQPKDGLSSRRPRMDEEYKQSGYSQNRSSSLGVKIPREKTQGRSRQQTGMTSTSSSHLSPNFEGLANEFPLRGSKRKYSTQPTKKQATKEGEAKRKPSTSDKEVDVSEVSVDPFVPTEKQVETSTTPVQSTPTASQTVPEAIATSSPSVKIPNITSPPSDASLKELFKLVSGSDPTSDSSFPTQSLNVNPDLLPPDIPREFYELIKEGMNTKNSKPIEDQNALYEKYLKDLEEISVTKQDDPIFMREYERSKSLIAELQSSPSMEEIVERAKDADSELQDTALAFVNLQRQEERLRKEKAGNALEPDQYQEVSDLLLQPLSEETFSKLEKLMNRKQLQVAGNLILRGTPNQELARTLQNELMHKSTGVITDAEEQNQLKALQEALKDGRPIPYVHDPRMFYARDPKPSDFDRRTRHAKSTPTTLSNLDNTRKSDNYNDYLFPTNQIISKQQSQTPSLVARADFTNDPIKTAEQAVGLNPSMNLEQKEKLLAEIKVFFSQHTKKPKSNTPNP